MLLAEKAYALVIQVTKAVVEAQDKAKLNVILAKCIGNHLYLELIIS